VQVFDLRLMGFGQGTLGPAAGITGSDEGGDAGDVTSGGSLLDTGGQSTLTSGGGGSPIYSGGGSSGGGSSGSSGGVFSSLTGGGTSNLPLIVGGFAVLAGLVGVAYYAHKKHTGR